MKSVILNCQLLYITIFSILLVGCASGPTYDALHSSEPTISANSGRIYIYRTTKLGAAVQPDVKVNDGVVGSAVPGGYFYVDLPAGNYLISTSTEVKRTLSMTLDPGQVRYVRLNLSMGFFAGHVWPELIENSVAENEIKDCHFVSPDKQNDSKNQKGPLGKM